MIRRFVIVLLLGLFAAPAFAAFDRPIPTFDNPKALLEAIYAQIKAGEDWQNFDEDSAFDDLQSFSVELYGAYLSADAKLKADGDEIGVLDFSPFINGQDSGGMDFAVGEPTLKGGRATIGVRVTGYQEQTIRFELLDEGTRGWKVDDIILPGYDGAPDWRLSDYFADPRASN